MDIVVDTRSVLISSWLPEFGDLVAGVIEVKKILREVGDNPESSEIGLSSNVEAAEVAQFSWLAFVFDHFAEAIEHTSIWVDTIWKWSHSVKTSLDSIEWHTENHSSGNTHGSCDKPVEHDWTEEVEHVFFHPVIGT